QAKAPDERVGVVAGPTPRWQCLQLVDVAAPEDDLLGLERGDQPRYDVLDVTSPLREAVRLQAAQSHVVLERSISVRQMAQLHRLHDALDDEGRAEACSQAEKEHLADSVASPPLQRPGVGHLWRGFSRS